VLTVAAGSLAEVLLTPVVGNVKTRLTGDSQEREVEAICRRAIEQAVRETVATDAIPKEQVELSIWLFKDLILSFPVSELAVVPSSPETLDAWLQKWRAAADAQGKDRSTWPGGFDAVVRRLIQILPNEFAKAGARSGSPVFPAVVMANLGLLRAHLSILLETQCAMVPLSAPLDLALRTAYNRCSRTDRAFSRAHLLQALLTIRGGAATAAFEAVGPGEAHEVSSQLARYISGPDSPRPFKSFDWSQQADITEARRIAVRENIGLVTDACVLVAVLEGSSRTIGQLKERLGQKRFTRLNTAARSLLINSPPPETPGRILET
jgi:hypothetical protein